MKFNKLVENIMPENVNDQEVVKQHLLNYFTKLIRKHKLNQNLSKTEGMKALRGLADDLNKTHLISKAGFSKENLSVRFDPPSSTGSIMIKQKGRPKEALVSLKYSPVRHKNFEAMPPNFLLRKAYEKLHMIRYEFDSIDISKLKA